MKYTFFNISTANPDHEADQLNTLLSSKRVLSVERSFVADGQNSFWAICVVYQDGEAAAKSSSRSKQIDYRDVLSPEDFTLYAKLREVRKQLASRDGVPSYAVMTNEQLAEVAKTRPQSITAIKSIPRFGEARAEKYGGALLSAVQGLAQVPKSGDLPE